MDLDVTVAVATFGGWEWVDLAERRAIPSIPDGVPRVHVHRSDGTLAAARNAALRKVQSEFVIHLDADDELAPGYVDAMARGTADLRAPAFQSVRHGRDDGEPFMPRVWSHEHDCTAECLRRGNWLVIGTCARTELVRRFGWEEFGWSEDWALWARCWHAGATVEAVPDAVYRGWWSRRSRNKATREEGLRWHRAIEEAVWGESLV